jgi:hypothetical protein
MMVFFLVSFVILSAATTYDIYQTRKGIVAGVAVEGFTFLVGPRPSTLALILRDGGIGLGLAAFGFLYLPLSAGMMLGYAARHIQGGLAWKKLL